MEARSVHAGQSNLYLLWLALDGVEPGSGRVTLSWIADNGRDTSSPSPLLSLLIRPDRVKASIADLIGGFEVQTVQGATEADADRRPEPSVPRSDLAPSLAAASGRLDPCAAASAHACSRRFAIQWALGNSASFRAEHHQAMLYGNVLGALQLDHGMGRGEAESICDDLWRHLTVGERRSSFFKRVVKPGGATAEWVLTLAGSGYRDHPTGIDAAYVAARDASPPDAELLAGDPGMFLPAGTHDERACRSCPVRDRCNAALLEST
jgi:hypothetical protein